MIRDRAARCRVRAVGTAVGLVAVVGVGAVTVSLSPSGWHTLAVAALVMLATAGAAVLVVGHLGAARDTRRAGAPLLEWGGTAAIVATVGLVVVGFLALLTDEPATAAITTWLTALVAAGPAGLGLQGRRDVRQPGDPDRRAA